MKIEDYLKEPLGGRAKRGDLGRETDWLDFCDLVVRGTKVQIVDASYVPDEREGCMVMLNPGVYQVQVKLIIYGEDVRVSRLRVFHSEMSASIGSQIGEVGTDTANIGVCDHDVFAHVWGDDNEASWEIISPTIEEAETHGIAVLDEKTGVIMPFVRSGFGDGTFPVHELICGGSRLGFEVTFVEKNTTYPFGAFCL